jgi:hypothetical protein
MSKKTLGQFYTTNYEYILQDINIPADIENIIEPFAGNGDLVNFIKLDNITRNIETYDIDPKLPETIKRDTLLNPPIYKNKYVITNPPYLARNKSHNKTIFDTYLVNDLYKCFICELIRQPCLGGILIIPLNFWSSIRDADCSLRKRFILKYNIMILNIFEERVFDDTTATVCAFQFTRRIKGQTSHTIPIFIYPNKISISAKLNKGNNYTIGGFIYKLPISSNPKYTVSRLTTKNKDSEYSCIKVKCIDDNADNMISLRYMPNDIFIDTTARLSARTYATLVITPYIDEENQKKLCRKFNSFLRMYRNKYHSLFLSNYRESKDIARKRISFSLVYEICQYLLEKHF